MSAVVPFSYVQAEEINNSFLQKKVKIDKELSNVKFQPIIENDDYTTLKVIYADGKTSLSEYNKKTGEVFFDGVLVATIKEEKSSGPIEPLIFNDEPPAFSIASVQQFVIGSKMGSSYINQYSRDFTISVAVGATTIAIAASLATLYLEKKPDIQSAGLVAAAAQLLALTTTNYTYKVRYTHYKDGQYDRRYMDKLSIYKGSIDTGNLKMQILHYYGKVY
jgi:hypothetical protein